MNLKVFDHIISISRQGMNLNATVTFICMLYYINPFFKYFAHRTGCKQTRVLECRSPFFKEIPIKTHFTFSRSK